MMSRGCLDGIWRVSQDRSSQVWPGQEILSEGQFRTGPINIGQVRTCQFWTSHVDVMLGQLSLSWDKLNLWETGQLKLNR